MKLEKYNEMLKAIRQLRTKKSIGEAFKASERLINELFLELAEEQAKSDNWQLFVSVAYYEKGMIFKLDGNIDEAVWWFSEALKLQQNMISLKNLFGFIYFAYSSFEIAECRRIGSIEKSDLEKDLKHTEETIKLAINILVDEAGKGSKIREIDSDIDYHLAGMWSRRAILNEVSFNYEQAIKFYKQALKFAKRRSCEFEEAEIEKWIAKCHSELSLKHYKKSAKVLLKNKNKER